MDFKDNANNLFIYYYFFIMKLIVVDSNRHREWVQSFEIQCVSWPLSCFFPVFIVNPATGAVFHGISVTLL